MGSSSTYGALSGAGITNTGPTKVNGDLGTGPGSSVVGFPPGVFTGTEHLADPAASTAEADLTIAYNNASGRSNCMATVAGNIGGQTLTPGLYRSTSSLAISSGDLTLNGGGNPNGIFIFQVASALTTTSGRAVVLTNGAQAGNIFWQIGSSATLGTTSTMVGTIMAYASITMATGSTLDGRALARVGDVTLAASTIQVPTTVTSPTYAVTFTEGGLPSGTSWSATLNGVAISSTSTTVPFTVANGTYSYQIGAMADYAASPSSGTVTVAGEAIEPSIGFTGAGSPGTYAVTFTESGLTPGMTWSVTMNGGVISSSTNVVQFAATDGTSTYTVGLASGYNATPSSGLVTVHGAQASQSIVFTVASGGPSPGNGGSGAGAGPGGLPTWAWAVLGILAIGAIAGVAAFLSRRRRGRSP